MTKRASQDPDLANFREWYHDHAEPDHLDSGDRGGFWPIMIVIFICELLAVWLA